MTSYFLWHFAQLAASFALKAVVAGAAGFAFVDVFHGDDIAALLHFEEAGLMAIRALEALVGVDLSVKDDLACSLAVELDRLAGRNRESGHRQGERYDNYECQYEKFLHCGFTSFRFGMNKSAHEIVYRMKTWQSKHAGKPYRMRLLRNCRSTGTPSGSGTRDRRYSLSSQT